MLILATRDALVSMLADAGVNPDAMTPAAVRTTVEVFRGFAALPVEGVLPPEEDGDGVLAQFGTYDFRGRPEFSADLTRQFAGAGGVDAPVWQLSCTLYWAAHAATEGLGCGHLWSFGKTLDEFFAEAGALPGWAWALDSPEAPQDLVITFAEL
ncbi:hypothetical protein [Krasilnikovia sp. MM14-A1259]|uniref:hypothetical protein n=1 Tax=Krasilnikovia sp. MM14-A1259 TaxID=3373539 RepID=UPI0037F676C0